VRKLRQKIEPDPNAPRILVTELGVGYRLAQPGELDQPGWAGGPGAPVQATTKAD
jgi:two-component system, OmpR family, KDP operon response regulator KdpE